MFWESRKSVKWVIRKFDFSSFLQWWILIHPGYLNVKIMNSLTGRKEHLFSGIRWILGLLIALLRFSLQLVLCFRGPTKNGMICLWYDRNYKIKAEPLLLCCCCCFFYWFSICGLHKLHFLNPVIQKAEGISDQKEIWIPVYSNDTCYPVVSLL